MLFKKLLLLALGASLFVACKKEESYETPVPGAGGGSSSIQGNYEFAGIEVDVQTTNTTTYAGSSAKTIMHTYYISRQNTGAVTIDDKNINFVALGYTVDTVVKVDSYLDNVFDETFDFPFTFSMPPYSSGGLYSFKGADSVVTSGSGYVLTSTGSAMETGPSVSKYYWSGDTLFMRSRVNFAYSQDMGQGIRMSVSHNGAMITKLKKIK